MAFPNHAPYGLAEGLVDRYLLALDDLRPGLGTFVPAISSVPDCNATGARTASWAPGNPNQAGETRSST